MSVNAPTIFGELGALPRGPHGLDREAVAAQQRTRVMAAFTALLAEEGWAGTTITATARRAGVSPNVFYAHFADKQECLFAAYEVFASALLTRMAAEVTPETGWSDFVESTLDAYLGGLDADRLATRAFLIEMDAAGPEARRRRREAYRGFALLLRERHEQIRRADPRLGPLSERTYLGLVHGVRELVCDQLEDDPSTPLRGLAPDIVAWLTATVRGA